MDNRPIGIFDSGLGGLTALSRLRELLDNEDFVYLADTARMPYGDKSYDELLGCAKDDISFLLSKNVKAILIACGTVSSNLSGEQFEKIPVLTEGVILPSVKKAAENSKKIGVIATAASIRAGAYKRELLRINPTLSVFPVACPKFVPLIESGKTSSEDTEVIEAAREYLEPLKNEGIDTLILGCTHYPLLSDAIRDVLPDVTLIDVGAAAAESLSLKIDRASLGKKGNCEFYVTSNKEGFIKNGEKFLEEKIDAVNLISF